MFIIKSIEVEDFWENCKISVDLYEDVNIFIGKNGSGKTTFINLLEATLTADINRLSSYKFKKIRINLSELNHKRQILVERDPVSDDIFYKIGTSKFEFRYYERNAVYRSQFGYTHPHLSYNIKLLKERLSELLGITYLSVHRNVVKKESEVIQDEQNIQQNPVDARLTELMSKLTSYQLELQASVNDLSKQFQRDILKLMLYDLNYDKIKFDAPISIDFDKLRKGLTQAYKDLGLLDEEQKQKINHHLEVIKTASIEVNKAIAESKPLYVDSVTALTLMKRSEKIAALSSALEQKRTNVFEPLNNYVNLISDNFIGNKTLRFANGKKHDLMFTKDDREFLPSQLSSGEKQLLILFTEALLQKRGKSIFIADEPELSLHIQWQRKVISTLQSLNPNAQLILATHSPEIVGPLKNRTINMKDIMANG